MPGQRNSSLPPLDDPATLCFTEYNISFSISCVHLSNSTEFAQRASLGSKEHSKQDDSLVVFQILLEEYAIIIPLGFEILNLRISLRS